MNFKRRIFAVRITLIWTLVLQASGILAQNPEPGTIPWTAVDRSGLERVTIEVPPQFSSLGLTTQLNSIDIPTGWTAKIFFAGSALNKARFIAWGPDSVLFVANMNRNNVIAIPDRNKDGVGDTAIVAASGFSFGHDVRFYRDTMFVCQEAGVVKLWRSDPKSYVYDQRMTLINKSAQGNQIGGNHRTRTLVLDTINFKLYVSVGSRGNADREIDRAIIEEYSWDGTGRRTYAYGVRNAVGMTLHPRTGRLWANNNGSDLQGNNVPPEWFDLVRENGFYGYPFSYHYQNYFNFTVSDYKDLLPITAQDTLAVKSMKPSAALLASHCAPMSVLFASPDNPTQFKNGAFMALRGSWNRTPISGTKVVFVEFDNDGDTIANVVRDVCAGFIRDSNNADSRWARPVGLAVAPDGSLFITSDDLKQFVLKLTPPNITSVEGYSESFEVECTPNPSLGDVTVSWQGAFRPLKLQVCNSLGNTIQAHEIEAGNSRQILTGLASGSYTIRFVSTTGVRSQLFTVVK